MVFYLGWRRELSGRLGFGDDRRLGEHHLGAALDEQRYEVTHPAVFESCMRLRDCYRDLLFWYMRELAHEPLVHLVDQRRLAAEAWHFESVQPPTRWRQVER